MRRRIPHSRLARPAHPSSRETLERVLRWSGIAEKLSGRRVAIFSTEWGMYWRPKGEGYTQSLSEAGRWEFAEALQMTRHCGPDKGIDFEIVEAG